MFANTTGTLNTAIGRFALANNTIGNNNVVLGDSALASNTTGNNNIAIGTDAGGTLTTGSNNIYIGFNIGAVSSSENDITRIANIYGTTTGSVTTLSVLVDNTGQLSIAASTKRVKHAIADMSNESDAIYNLRPVTFAYNSDASETKQYGLIAEEVADVFPGIVVRDAEDEPFTVQYHVLPVLLLNEVQKLYARIEDMNDRLIALEQQD